jgi:hypothetical protein
MTSPRLQPGVAAPQPGRLAGATPAYPYISPMRCHPRECGDRYPYPYSLKRGPQPLPVQPKAGPLATPYIKPYNAIPVRH